MRRIAATKENLLPMLIEAAEARCGVGEIMDALAERLWPLRRGRSLVKEKTHRGCARIDDGDFSHVFQRPWILTSRRVYPGGPPDDPFSFPKIPIDERHHP